MTSKMSSTGLTVSKATSQAGRIARNVMPGLGPDLSVSSKNGWDAEVDVQVVITTITFPKDYNRGFVRELEYALYRLDGWWGQRRESDRIIIARKVN
jgi:hypothetical protein